MEIRDKIKWLLKYCSEYPGHEFMYDERLEDVNTFNIDLGVETYILDNIDDTSLILLTGDAGDGKSRVLSNLKDNLDNLWIYINDFSELNQAEQQKCIEKIYDGMKRKDKKYIVAGNSGIFINAIIQYKYELLTKLKNRENCLVLNFKNRNLAEKSDMFFRIVKEYLNYSDFHRCHNCALVDKCPFIYNLEKMNNEEIIERIRVIFDTLFLMGIHITFRDLLSIISYFVTRGIDCDQLLTNNNIEQFHFYNNIFCYNGYLNTALVQIRELDIANKDVNKFDFEVFHNPDNYICSDINRKNYNDNLQLLKVLKRFYFFMEPKKIDCTVNSLYSLLPIEHLDEYKLVINKIKNFNYIDSLEDDDEILRKFELGLNKISNPNYSNAQLVLFDSPPITSKDVRVEYSSGQQLRLVFATPTFYFSNGESEFDGQGGLEHLNAFYCFVYYENDTFEKCPVIRIDYNIFNQIMLAENNIFTDKNVRLSDNVHIQSFTKAIFDNIDSDYGVKITWTGTKGRNLMDFDMSFIKPSGLGRSRNNVKKISISSVGR